MSYCQSFNCTSFVFTLTKNQFRLFSMESFFDSCFHLKNGSDMHPNPGPCHRKAFKLCHWNLNSIAVNDFIKIPLIETYNFVYNYDIIALSETYLDSSVTNESISLTGFSKEIYTWFSILLVTFNYRARGTCDPSTLNYSLNGAANA